MNDVITHTKNKMNTRTFNVISFNDFRKMAKNAIQQQLDNGLLDAVDIMEGMPVLSFEDLRKWNDYWYFILGRFTGDNNYIVTDNKTFDWFISGSSAVLIGE